MELQKIEQLLDKYFEGETSQAEEQTLREYFKNNRVAAHLEIYKNMFAYFSQAKEESFDAKIKAVSPVKTRKNRLFFRYAAAATVIAAFGIAFFFQQNSNALSHNEQEAIAAYEKTKEALQMLSSHFNESVEQLAYINEFETSKNKIFK